MEVEDSRKRSAELLAQFEPWTDPTNNEHAPMVLIGAGLSFGLAPRADDLALEVGERRLEIEKSFGVDTGHASIDCTKQLYRWAEQCLALKLKEGVRS